MVDYVKMRLTAERLIDENGRDVTLLRRDRAVADPVQPWRGPAVPGTDSSVTVRAVLLEFDSAQVDGDLIRRDDMRALVSAEAADAAGAGTIEVETYDVLVDRGTHWEIRAAREIEPGSVRVLYDLQLRK